MDELKKIVAYCRERIENYDERVSVALGLMDRMRCDLHTADWKLAAEIEGVVTEWADDNGYDVDFFDGIDVDEIIFTEE